MAKKGNEGRSLESPSRGALGQKQSPELANLAGSFATSPVSCFGLSGLNLSNGGA